MRTTILICCLQLLPFFKVVAQDNLVRLNFFVDGEEVKLNSNYKVSFITDLDTINAATKGDSLIIPSEIRKADLTFSYGKYTLDFKDLNIVINEFNRSWIIGVDNKPFNKKKYHSIKHWSKVYLVYYLENNKGSRMLVQKRK